MFAMAVQPTLSKAWTDSSLLGALDSVEAHSKQLASSPLTEKEMQVELQATRL